MVVAVKIPSTPKWKEKSQWQPGNAVRGHKGCLLPTVLLSGGSWGTRTLVLFCHWMRQEGLGLSSHPTAPLPLGVATGREERLTKLWLLLVFSDGFAVRLRNISGTKEENVIKMTKVICVKYKMPYAPLF